MVDFCFQCPLELLTEMESEGPMGDEVDLEFGGGLTRWWRQRGDGF
ncbi:hypothetical protein L195_g023640 [Trifolium pratense]|uniref:Uncharacterized protein n=1 Tax=Trifolium pratense TaxID=57577 RepID=A0A2K3NBH6_TRIPR|nr:hypothetical protein L195_g023640 [Trifolium pratense]